MAFTPIWGSGFEMGDIPLRAGIASEVNSTLISTSNPHTGNYCIRVGSSFNNAYLRVQVGSRTNLAIGAWAKYSAVQPSDFRINMNFSTGTLYLQKNAADSTWDLYTLIGSTLTLIASGIIPVTLTEWHNLQIYFDGSQIQTRINGVLDITAAWSTAITSVDFYGSGSNGGYGGYWDDIAIGHSGWPGDIRYDVLTPDGDTAVHGWLPSLVSLQAAPAAPTVGVAAGPGITGDYHYKVTLVDTDGETLGGTASALVQPANQVVALTGIPTGLEGTTARKIYRTAAGGSVYKLVTTISNNTATTYNDSLADASLGANEPGNTHYDKIDEIPPSDTDYIYTATNGVQDIHTLTDWDATKKVPLYVVQWERAWKDTADPQTLKLLLKSGTTSTLRTSTAHELAITASYEFEIHTTDPDGAAWTNAEIDALQSGVEAVIP